MIMFAWDYETVEIIIEVACAVFVVAAICYGFIVAERIKIAAEAARKD